MLLQYQMADSLADTSGGRAATRCFAAGATMAESFNCIESPANKCAAKFVNKSTSQPVLPTAFLPASTWEPRTHVCARIEIRNALKCSPVSHEAPPHPCSAVSHATDDKRHFGRRRCQFLSRHLVLRENCMLRLWYFYEGKYLIGQIQSFVPFLHYTTRSERKPLLFVHTKLLYYLQSE